ncbi:hemerythrin domain-containing protein [Sphingomonas sp. DT-204]|uniref:hemerythrin domain-containing protein n=1 Tax=Sphingomonas sp. DT-204 TaxID=3396166 RepID=UPI003F197A9E
MATTSASRSRSTSSQKNGGSSSNLGTLAGVGAAGMALGMLAMLARKAVVQAPTLLAGEWDQALAAEHKAVLKLFDAIEATESRNTSKRSILLAQLKHSLAKHALEEENVIYPALREAGETDAADELNKEHGYIKQYLYELENMPNDSPDYLTTVRRFRAEIEEHIAEEENQLFPSLKAKLSEEKNKLLTAAMNKEGFKLA